MNAEDRAEVALVQLKHVEVLVLRLRRALGPDQVLPDRFLPSRLKVTDRFLDVLHEVDVELQRALARLKDDNKGRSF